MKETRLVYCIHSLQSSIFIFVYGPFHNNSLTMLQMLGYFMILEEKLAIKWKLSGNF